MTSYNVILTHADGSTFECAEGVTLKRAVQIKNEIITAQAKGDFSYRDVTAITIVEQGGENS